MTPLKWEKYHYYWIFYFAETDWFEFSILCPYAGRFDLQVNRELKETCKTLDEAMKLAENYVLSGPQEPKKENKFSLQKLIEEKLR